MRLKVKRKKNQEKPDLPLYILLKRLENVNELLKSPENVKEKQEKDKKYSFHIHSTTSLSEENRRGLHDKSCFAHRSYSFFF
jgi:hypothetical protein